VVGYAGNSKLGKALKGCNLVIIPTRVRRKPSMTRDELFNVNVGIVKSLCTSITKHCPKALVNIISNPINSTIPIATQVFKKVRTYDPKRLFGITTLDVVCAKTFYAAKMKVPIKGTLI